MTAAHAYSLTGRSMASALLCRPRAKQDVRVISRRHGGRLPARIVVAVAGKFYEVRPSTLDDLHGGSTPEYLGLEEYQIPDEPEDYPEYDRAASAADRRHQFNKESL
jgi:hypothetical protein